MAGSSPAESIVRLALWLFLLLFSAGPLADSGVDPALKLRLAQALADSTGQRDRFDAEVWLTDMANRLQKVVPDPDERYAILKHVYIEANRAGLHPELVLAVIQVESRFDRFALSEAGARGLMQVMPFWLKELNRPGDDLFHIPTNLRFGCTILKYYLDMEQGDLTRALARYNGSVGKNWYPQRVYTALQTRWYR